METLADQIKDQPHLSLRVTGLTTFMQCRRKWALQYLGWENPNDNGLARFRGTLVHAGLEAHYLGLDALEAIDQAVLDEIGPLPEEGHPDYVAEAIRYARPMVAQYIEFMEHTGDDLGREVVAVEAEFEQRWEGHVLTGHADLITDGPEGRTLTDHKTTSKKYEIHPSEPQLMWYAVLAEEMLDIPIDNVEHNILKVNLHTGRGTPPFFWRSTVPVNSDMRHNAAQMLANVVKDIDVAVVTDTLYPNPVSSGQCGWCQYKDVCPQFDDGSDWAFTLETNYRKADDEGHDSSAH